MVRQETVLDLVDRIYAAAEDPRLWDAFLEQLGRQLHSPFLAIGFEDFRNRTASIARSIGFDPGFQHDYEVYWAGRNVWMNAAVQRAGRGEGGDGIVTSEHLLPKEVFLRTDFYNDFIKKMGLRYLSGSVIYSDTTSLTHLSLIRPKRSGPYGDGEIALLRTLNPNLQRGLQLHRRIVELRQANESLSEALDHVAVGIVVLDRSGRVQQVNRAAGSVVAAKDGLAIEREGLRAASSPETARLRALVGQAVGAGSGGGFGSGGTMTVSRPSAKRPYALFVTPLRSKESLFGAGGASAAVFITDPERDPNAPPDTLRRLYGFTTAESRMAAHLMSGESVEEAAESLAISANTARTHVRHLLEKTGTHRYGELVRILLLALTGLVDIL
jgi:DNA-binding CsgD family transcriptional regulator